MNGFDKSRNIVRLFLSEVKLYLRKKSHLNQFFYDGSTQKVDIARSGSIGSLSFLHQRYRLGVFPACCGLLESRTETTR